MDEKTRQIIKNLSRDEFRNYVPLIREELFSEVASGAGSAADTQRLGDKINQIGLFTIDPHNTESVRQAALSLTCKVYQFYFHI